MHIEAAENKTNEIDIGNNGFGSLANFRKEVTQKVKDKFVRIRRRRKAVNHKNKGWLRGWKQDFIVIAQTFCLKNTCLKKVKV